MKNINFTDWQDLWLKKDVEEISRKINRIPVFNLVVLIDITIAIATLAITMISFINDKDGIDKKTLICIIKILVGTSILVPILYYVISYWSKILNAVKLIKTDSINVKPYIDIFDNKICNCIMMAYSLHENILSENKPEVNCYYICETSYYINRCIDEFIRMGSMVSLIFGRQVAYHRLLLAINLILELRKETNTKIHTPNLSNNKIIDNIIVENANYDKIFNVFIIEINNIFGL